MLEDLRGQVRNKIFSLVRTDLDGKQFYALVPGFLRLAFHACAANWCSSRVDLSDPANNGLQDAVPAADELHVAVQNNPRYTGFSKADLYALCGAVALEVATRNKTRVKFRYGRPDFFPQDDVQALNQRIPSPRLDTDATLAFMKSVFNFTPKETVAFTGAHSLGAVRNFLRPPEIVFRWVSSPADTLTNEFYRALLDTRWHQVDRLFAGRSAPARVWVIDQLPTRLMFNTDLGLVRRISGNITSGVSQCTTYLSCPLASTAGFVYTYALSQNVFFSDFGRVYAKMLENGLSQKLRDVMAY